MWPFWLIAIVCTVSCAVFARVRVILRNAHRSRSVQRVCASVIPTQGSVFVMIHCPDASEKCARLYQDLMDTAACPKRVFVGVYQEMTHSTSDVARLVHGARDHLRVINTTKPTTTAFAVRELLGRCWRASRTIMLLSVDSHPTTGWDTEILVDIGEAEMHADKPAISAQQSAQSTGATGFPTWHADANSELVLVARPFGSFDDDSSARVVPIIAASASFCVARASTWHDARYVEHTDADLSLSASLAPTAELFTTRHVPFYGGVSHNYFSCMNDDASMQSIIDYGDNVGIIFGKTCKDVKQISGRAQMGLTTNTHDELSGSEILVKYGSLSEYERHRAHFV